MLVDESGSTKKIRVISFSSHRVSKITSRCFRVRNFRGLIFTAVIFAPVLFWASFPPSDSRSCVWGGGEGERGGAGGHSKSGGERGAGTKGERGGRGIEGGAGEEVHVGVGAFSCPPTRGHVGGEGWVSWRSKQV